MRFFDSQHDVPKGGWLEFVKPAPEPVTSHEFARRLLAMPDLPIYVDQTSAQPEAEQFSSWVIIR